MTAPTKTRAYYVETLRAAADVPSPWSRAFAEIATAVESMSTPVLRAGDVEQWRWTAPIEQVAKVAEQVLAGAR